MSNMKIDLAILNKVVKELNDQFALVLKAKSSSSGNENVITELAKCMGLASAVSIESSALTQDFIKQVKIYSSPDAHLILDAEGESKDPLAALFGNLNKKN